MVLGKRGREASGSLDVSTTESGSISCCDVAILACMACSVSLSCASWLLWVKQLLKARTV